jgi:hypothetical protein
VGWCRYALSSEAGTCGFVFGCQIFGDEPLKMGNTDLQYSCVSL